MGDPFDVRDPTALLLQAHLPPGGDVDKVLRTRRRGAATGSPPTGSTEGELARTQARMATHLLRDTDAVLGRALQMAVLEQQRGDPGLLNELPRLVGEVTEEQVRAAAATLRPQRRASIEVVAGGARVSRRRMPTARASCRALGAEPASCRLPPRGRADARQRAAP